MRKFFLIIILIFSASCFAESVPDWLKSPEKAFPTKEYIRAIGDGSSENVAKNAAIAQIALLFESKVEVINLALKQSSQIITEDKVSNSTNANLTQFAKISSTAEFFCLNFTEPYYNKKNNNFTILAYIKKSEVCNIYKTRIEALLTSILAYKNYASGETEIFRSAQALQNATVLGNLCERYINTFSIIKPDVAKKYEDDLKMISGLASERANLKKHMTFSIQLLQEEVVYKQISSCIAKILEKQGYSYSLSNAKYNITVDIVCTEESYDAGQFVRPSLDILIVNTDGEGVYSYSKPFQRIGGKTMDQAYVRAVSKIKQDLEENFLAE